MKTDSSAFMIILLTFIMVLNVSAQEKTKKDFDMKHTIVGGMEYVIIQHEVQDFKRWKDIFDADKPAQNEAGLRLMLLLQASNNPNNVTVIFEYADQEKIDTFFANPLLGEKMQLAGVIGKPEFTFFKTESSGLPTHDAYLLVKHKVADYVVWKKGFDEDEKVRKEYDLRLVALGKNIKEEGNVVVLINSSETSNILSFMENSGLKEKMAKYGVISEPAIDILNAPQ